MFWLTPQDCRCQLLVKVYEDGIRIDRSECKEVRVEGEQVISRLAGVDPPQWVVRRVGWDRIEVIEEPCRIHRARKFGHGCGFQVEVSSSG